jgi:hypothetical protein
MVHLATMMRCWPVSVLFLGLSGCWAPAPSEFRCTTNDECELAGTLGFCESNNRCSLLDPGCPTRRRYHASAGADATDCVLPAGPTLSNFTEILDYGERRQTGAAGIIGETIYMAGGKSSQMTSDEYVNVIKSSFAGAGIGPFENVTGADIPYPAAVGAILYADEFWLIGGCKVGTPDSCTDKVYRSTPLPDEKIAWNFAKGLGSRRASAGIAVDGTTVYVTGGRTGKHGTGAVALDDVVRFDLTDGTDAIPTSSMQNPRYGHASVVVGDHLFVIGGCTDNTEICAHSNKVDTVEMAPILDDGRLGAFSPAQPLPLPLAAASAIAIGDRIIVVGGRDDRSTSNGGRATAAYYAQVYPDGTLSDWFEDGSLAMPMKKFHLQRVGDVVWALGDRIQRAAVLTR